MEKSELECQLSVSIHYLQFKHVIESPAISEALLRLLTGFDQLLKNMQLTISI